MGIRRGGTGSRTLKGKTLRRHAHNSMEAVYHY